MSALAAGAAADAAALTLAHSPLPAESVHAGAPTTALHPLASIGGVEIGV